MRRIVLFLVVVAIALVIAVPAFAQGPGGCAPPGTVFSVMAKEQGPNQFFGTPVGSLVKASCAPGQVASNTN